MLEPCAPPCFPLTRHATPLSSLRLGAWEERTCSDQILRDRVEKGVPLLLPELSALLSEGILRHSGALEYRLGSSVDAYDSAGLILL